MKLNRKTTLLALAMSAGLSVSALNPINLGSGLELTPLGTMLLDGATYAGENHKDFHTGAAIQEARLGALMTMGRWSARLEVGYAYNKVLLKDAYFQFDIDSHNYLRAGQTVHQFGLQNSTAACQKVTMIETENNTIFNESQMIGLMYVHADSTIFATASLHTESGATTSLTGGPGGLSDVMANLLSLMQEVIYFNLNSSIFPAQELIADRSVPHPYIGIITGTVTF